jgi:predicted nuclease of predicted toxin-antitoxin system
MTGLFARLYLDEDVSARTAEMISARGFDVLSTVKAGRISAPDRDQLDFAANQSRVLVTHNRRDFELLIRGYFTSGLPHAGVIIAVRRPPRDLTIRILALVNRNTADEFVNQVFYV